VRTLLIGLQAGKSTSGDTQDASLHCKSRNLSHSRHGLKVFENRVLRRICAPRRDEMVRGWSILNNRAHNLQSSPSIIIKIKSKADEMGRACGTYGRDEECI
jgi:hypothetical protein